MKKKLLAGMSLAVIILGIVLFINTNKDAAKEATIVDDVATVETVEVPEETVVEEIAEEAPVEEITEEVAEVEENTAPSFLTQEYANQVQEERDKYIEE